MGETSIIDKNNGATYQNANGTPTADLIPSELHFPREFSVNFTGSFKTTAHKTDRDFQQHCCFWREGRRPDEMTQFGVVCTTIIMLSL